VGGGVKTGRAEALPTTVAYSPVTQQKMLGFSGRRMLSKYADDVMQPADAGPLNDAPR